MTTSRRDALLKNNHMTTSCRDALLKNNHMITSRRDALLKRHHEATLRNQAPLAAAQPSWPLVSLGKPTLGHTLPPRRAAAQKKPRQRRDRAGSRCCRGSENCLWRGRMSVRSPSWLSCATRDPRCCHFRLACSGRCTPCRAGSPACPSSCSLRSSTCDNTLPRPLDHPP